MSGPTGLLILLLSLYLTVTSTRGHDCDLEHHPKETTTESVSTTPRKNDIEVVDLDADSDDDSEADNSEAFNDLEDEDLICSNYVEAPKQKVLPHAVVIGARKGGTRALLEFININSRVRRAKSEVHFYDNNYDKGVDWYRDQMPAVLPGQICMEKTPGYFHTPAVAGRLWDTNNRTKLVLIIRNPVDRLISDYNQFRSRHMDRGNDYPPLEHFLFTENGNINIGYQPLQRSIYHYHLVRWMRYFPLEQIHIVDGDKFIKEPWTGLNKLENFLEIPTEITEENFFFNSTKGFYCGREKLTLPHSQWTCSRDKCLNKSKGRPKAKVEASTYETLKKFYAPHNEIFYKLVKQDFGWPAV